VQTLQGLVATRLATGRVAGASLGVINRTSALGPVGKVDACRVSANQLVEFALGGDGHSRRLQGLDLRDRWGKSRSRLRQGKAGCRGGKRRERLAFTDLLNFSADYRSTALFCEMHVGGAPLDAWLMLSFPFALASLLAARSPLARGLALVAVGLVPVILLSRTLRSKG